MGVKTKAQVEIEAAPQEVFAWLTEPDKLTAWMGSAGAMPSDSSQLHVGFTAAGEFDAPGGSRENTMEITEYDPPRSLGFRMTYAGGDSVTTYRLTPDGEKTILDNESDLDFAAPDLSQLDEAMKGQSAFVSALVDRHIHRMTEKLEGGGFDSDPRIAGGMNKALEESLAKLKGLIERGR